MSKLSDTANFSKYPDGLIPAVVQDALTGTVLMLGYMNRQSLEKTLDTQLVTFFSRSRKELWTKGETSGNVLHLREILLDCDNDAFLVKAVPAGPVCHTGNDTCFSERNNPDADDSITFLSYLQDVIKDRKAHPAESSYTNKLLNKGVNAIAQKVGEEAVELVIEAKDENTELFLGEAADLLYHLTVLLVYKGCSLEDVMGVLKKRHSR